MPRQRIQFNCIILFLSIMFATSSHAGQISVINPSAGTGITGAISAAPAATPPSNANTPISPNSNALPHALKSANDHAATLKLIDVSKFSDEQRQSLITMIEVKLSDTKISNYIKDILIEQIARLKL